MDIIERLGALRLVPVIKIENAADAVPLARALCRGGLPCAEITFRTSAAADAIAAISADMPDMLVGAGTVLSPAQADAAVAAGAKFIVSPGLNPTVVEHCVQRGYPVIPGICTPSEAELAMSFGLSAVKFFPAEAAGGLAFIKAISAPYPNLRFMPTGGINPSNVKSYLAFKKVFAAGGSWMVPADLIAAGDFDGIEKLAAQAAELVREV